MTSLCETYPLNEQDKKTQAQRLALIVDRLEELYTYALEARDRGVSDPVVWLIYPLEPGLQPIIEQLGEQDLESRVAEFEERGRLPAFVSVHERSRIIDLLSAIEGFSQTLLVLRRPKPAPDGFACIATYGGASMTMLLPPTIEQAREVISRVSAT